MTQRQSAARSQWKALSLNEYKSGHFHTLEEARKLLGYEDKRSLRTLVRELEIAVYSCPVNQNFGLLKHEDLLAISTYAHRPLVGGAEDRPPSTSVKTTGGGATRQLADLQVQYVREVSDLERRLVLEEERRIQDAQAYEERIASLQKQQERTVSELRERVQKLQHQLKEALKKRPNSPVVSKESKATIQRLPKEYTPLNDVIRVHSIDEHEFEGRIEAGEIPVVQGTWRAGKTLLSRALARDGHIALFRMFHTHEGFRPCDTCLQIMVEYP